MNRFMRIVLFAAIVLLLTGCGTGTTGTPQSAATAVPQPTEQAGTTGEPEGLEEEASVNESAAVQLFAVNVGKGDALILKVGGYVCLIDTGKTHVCGRVIGALKRMGIDSRLDAVFITHTDDDHTGGLRWLADAGSGLAVDTWYAPAMFTGVKAEKHPAVLAAARRDQEVSWLRRGDEVPLGDTGAVLKVLAPATLYQDKDDNNSLVMMLESDEGRILFAGDMELPEEAELLSYGDDLSCMVLKVPNHGDDDTTSEAFARAASARIALISTDSQEKPDTPDMDVVARLKDAGSEVVVTQDAGLGVWLTMEDGTAAKAFIDIGEAPVDGIYIAAVDSADDRIVLGNSSGEARDLSRFSLYSDRGNELFLFPENVSIGPGATLTVGTNSTDGSYDLLWDDKKVIHRKKTDVLCLYDRWGRLVDSRDNGM